MKTVDEFTDRELEQQIEMLKEMDVMGSKKLLNSFMEEKERREELRRKEEELQMKRKEQEEKDKEEAERKMAKDFSEIYGKCYKVEKGSDGVIQYYHVRGIIDDIIITDIVYKHRYSKSKSYVLTSEMNKFIRFDVFKNIADKENEISLSEFNAAKKDGMYNFDYLFRSPWF